MGLSRKKPNTNLITLRTELNRLNMNSDAINKEDSSDGKQSSKQVVSGSGANNVPLIREARKRGKKKDALIDGSRLLTC